MKKTIRKPWILISSMACAGSLFVIGISIAAVYFPKKSKPLPTPTSSSYITTASTGVLNSLDDLVTLTTTSNGVLVNPTYTTTSGNVTQINPGTFSYTTRVITQQQIIIKTEINGVVVASSTITLEPLSPPVKEVSIPQDALIIVQNKLVGFRLELITDEMNTLTIPNNVVNITTTGLPVLDNIRSLYFEGFLGGSPANSGPILSSWLPNLKSLDISKFTTFSNLIGYSTNALTTFFSNLTSLTSIKLGNISNFNGYSFSSCKSLNYIQLDQSANLIKLVNINENGNLVGQIVVPAGGLTSSTYDDVSSGTLAWGKIKLSENGILSSTSITTLGKNVFNGSNISSIDFSGTSIVSLGERAFNNCYNLTQIASWGNVNTLILSTFSNCYSLNSVDLSTITRIGNGAFQGCSSLTTVDLTHTIVDQDGGVGAFRGCYALNSVTVSDINNISDFGGYAFGNCPNLNNITIAPGVTSITKIDINEGGNLVGQIVVPVAGLNTTTYSSIFRGALAWGKIRLSESGILNSMSMTSLGSYVFNCSNISSIDFSGTSITSLGNNAFSSSNLSQVVSWNNVNKIGNDTTACYAFSGTKINSIDLTGVSLSTYASQNYSFQDCAYLNSVILGSATTLTGNIFSGCSSLQTINLDNATTLGSSAFSGCSSLESINLNDVTTLGSMTFYGCTSLKKIDFRTTAKRNFTGASGTTFSSLPRGGTVWGNDANNWLAYLITIYSTVFSTWSVGSP